MNDVGLTHVALPVTDLDESADFYERYAQMQIVHRRDGVLWLSDKTRPFVLVLIESDAVLHPLRPMAHLGGGLRESRRGRSARRARAGRPLPDLGSGRCRTAGRLLGVPARSDGHTLEVSFGQQVGSTVGNR
jgi:catechol 2,3-dioxygenase-like lactoylglutathione lyase family enzyme